MNLMKTVNMMKSDDFKERFKAEFHQLKIRRDGLQNMLVKYKNNELPFTPNCSYELLHKQLIFMDAYMEILCERAKIESIDLWEVCE